MLSSITHLAPAPSPSRPSLSAACVHPPLAAAGAGPPRRGSASTSSLLLPVISMALSSPRPGRSSPCTSLLTRGDHHQVPDGCAKSPARPVFVKFDYTAMTSELDRKRQVPHRQDHTDARTTTGPERLLHGYPKFCFKRVQLPSPCTTTSTTIVV